MTYQDAGYLYLLKRDTENRKQEDTAYRLRIYPWWENAIHLQTVLIGPRDGEEF